MINKVYTEYLIEYSAPDLMVYVNGLDADGFWEQIECHEDVNNPEDFAQGIVAEMKRIGAFAQAFPIDYLDGEEE